MLHAAWQYLHSAHLFTERVQFLQGASTTFQPLSGMLRGNCNPTTTSVLMRLALAHDKITVALYRRPLVRLLFTVYLALVHLAVALLVI